MSMTAQYTFTDSFGFASRFSRPLQFTMNLRGSGAGTVPFIYRLPTEMLSRIFELGTHDSDDANDAVEFPIQVSAVSKRFRDIACSTPRLWTTITFHSPRPSWYDPNSDEEYDYSYTRDCFWLERSRACPLDLVMSYRDMSWTFNEEKHYFRQEHMENILSIIAPHAHRIRKFILLCDTFSPLHAALRFLEREGPKMKALETLELYRCNAYVAEYPRFTPSALAKSIPLLGGCAAPKLTRVVLAGVHVDWDASKVPLSNLRSLELNYHPRDVRPSLHEFADILRRSPNLHELNIIGSGPVSTTIASQESPCILLSSSVSPIHLSHIHTFKFGYYQAQDALLLLQLVDAPNTVDLTIKDLSRPAEDDVAGGSSILHLIAHPETKVFSRLTSLSLENVKAAPESISASLHTVSSLHTLSLEAVSKESLAILADPDFSAEGKLPCPALKRLTLRLMPNEGVGCLSKVRADAGFPIEYLSIYFRDEVDEQDILLARRHSIVDLYKEEGDEFEETVWDDVEDPYAPGGAFNDPEFDSIFS
ncbi:hypothetical protein M422DRAFT_41075 [Sphaerobolus stellatus SS14]|nr:hypothetical protein M422DRAFT_41075 [Sphaerobolus stellatus SS14]